MKFPITTDYGKGWIIIDDPQWPTCECGGAKVNMWAAEGLCSPCTQRKIGAVEFERRYQATRAPNGSWAGPEASIAALEV